MPSGTTLTSPHHPNQEGCAMQITIDTENITQQDRDILALVLGGEAAPAPQKAAKPAATTKSKDTKPEPVEEPEEPADEAGDDEGEKSEGASMEDAVALATKLVSNGKAAQVKAALSDCGAKRVSELDESKIGEFIAALS